jgi:hypothetical protein
VADEALAASLRCELTRGLPIVDPAEIERASGFVLLVERVAAIPLTFFGVVATVAAIVFHWPWLAAGAALVTASMLLALRADTRLAKALQRLGSGDVTGAERALRSVARSPRATVAQRQVARGHLAAISWSRGDVEEALRWTQRKIAGRAAGSGETSREAWMADATEVQLLVLARRVDWARARLKTLGEPPPDDEASLVHASTELLVAFAGGEAADVLEARLDGWEELARARDGVGTVCLLLAWARERQGAVQRAHALIDHADERGDARYLERHHADLLAWARGWRTRLHYARG